MLGSAMAVSQQQIRAKGSAHAYLCSSDVDLDGVHYASDGGYGSAADHGSQAAFNLSDRSAGAGNEGGGAPPRQ
jgi:hypothetical protein